MKLTIEKTVKESVEVDGELPLYYQYGSSFMKIISENEFIVVTGLESMLNPCIEKGTYSPRIHNYLKDGIRITENQFIDAFVKAVYLFQGLVNEPTEETRPSSALQFLQKAV